MIFLDGGGSRRRPVDLCIGACYWLITKWAGVEEWYRGARERGGGRKGERIDNWPNSVAVVCKREGGSSRLSPLSFPPSSRFSCSLGLPGSFSNLLARPVHTWQPGVFPIGHSLLAPPALPFNCNRCSLGSMRHNNGLVYK